MITPQLKKAKQVPLRSLGFDERWLQDRINEDPTLLNLGDLRVIQKEKPQAPGGRIDFLMHDDDEDVRYVVEVQLGATDESHIIRAIEYWDIERQRHPTVDHRAVLVAEAITARFFNVIRLLNRAVPMIAIQLSALQVDGGVVLHNTKVLDIWEEIGGSEEEPVERADRHYWDERATKESMSVVDKMIQLLKAAGLDPRVTYNRGHIAVGTSGQNFCWFHPRKQLPRCHVIIRVGNENRELAAEQLGNAGIGTTFRGKTRVRVSVTPEEVQEHAVVFGELLALAEKRSKVKGVMEEDEE